MKITWEYDEEYDKLDIYVDGKLCVEWSTFGIDPKYQVKEFKRIFMLGYNYNKEG